MTEDIIKRQGIVFLAHLLRRLSDEFVRGLAAWTPETGTTTPPRTLSTLETLNALGPMSVTEVAAAIRQSHPHVITWVRQLKALGLIESWTDPQDRRRTVLALTNAGKAEMEAQAAVKLIVARAYEQLMAESDADLLDALWRVEAACRRLPFANRLRAAAAQQAEEP